MKKLLVAAALVAVTLPLVAQETGKGVLGQVGALGQEVKRAPLPTGPAPRLPDGTIDLNGLWVGGGPACFNDKFWFDHAGHPHTEQLHTIERWTRLDLRRLENRSPSTIPARIPAHGR